MLIMLLWAGLPAVLACDTPVYEYTIHMWDREPYQVLYVHDGVEDAADREVNAWLRDASEGRSAEVNLQYVPADIGSTRGAGAAMRQQYPDLKLPFHVVISPRGFTIAAERLTLTAARALADSPNRDALADLLVEGKQGVMVLLPGADVEANQAARQAVEAAMTEAATLGCDPGLVEVNRNDPSEKWFVRQLLGVEDDLSSMDSPMLFGVFGRGHVLEPFVGRGVSKSNLLDLIGFMRGPCACEIKAEAPGTDLLMACNWDERLAAWQPSETFRQEYLELPVMPPETTEETEQPTAPVTAPPPEAEPLRSGAAPEPRARTAHAPPAFVPRAPVPKRAMPAPRLRPPAGPDLTGPKGVDPGTLPWGVPAPPVGDAPAALDEAARGPRLPQPPPEAARASVPQPAGLRLALPLGIAIGVMTLGALLGGLALWLHRRETVD